MCKECWKNTPFGEIFQFGCQYSLSIQYSPAQADGNVNYTHVCKLYKLKQWNCLIKLVPMQQHHHHHLRWMNTFKRWHHDILIIIKKKMGPWIMAPWYILIIIIKSSNPTSNSNNEIVWLNLVVEGGRWLNFDQYTMCIIQCFTILTV